jgi:hypothetical protein
MKQLRDRDDYTNLCYSNASLMLRVQECYSIYIEEQHSELLGTMHALNVLRHAELTTTDETARRKLRVLADSHWRQTSIETGVQPFLHFLSY